MAPGKRIISGLVSVVNNNGDRKSPSNNNGDRKIPIWVFPNIGVGPQNGWFIMDTPKKFEIPVDTNK